MQTNPSGTSRPSFAALSGQAMAANTLAKPRTLPSSEEQLMSFIHSRNLPISEEDYFPNLLKKLPQDAQKTSQIIKEIETYLKSHRALASPSELLNKLPDLLEYASIRIFSGNKLGLINFVLRILEIYPHDIDLLADILPADFEICKKFLGEIVLHDQRPINMEEEDLIDVIISLNQKEQEQQTSQSSFPATNQYTVPTTAPSPTPPVPTNLPKQSTTSPTNANPPVLRLSPEKKPEEQIPSALSRLFQQSTFTQDYVDIDTCIEIMQDIFTYRKLNKQHLSNVLEFLKKIPDQITSKLSHIEIFSYVFFTVIQIQTERPLEKPTYIADYRELIENYLRLNYQGISSKLPTSYPLNNLQSNEFIQSSMTNDQQYKVMLGTCLVYLFLNGQITKESGLIKAQNSLDALLLDEPTSKRILQVFTDKHAMSQITTEDTVQINATERSPSELDTTNITSKLDSRRPPPLISRHAIASNKSTDRIRETVD